jgi:ABC-type Mn2+/Zn2+ transport system permease subunit
MNYHFSWAGVFTFTGLVALLLMRRRGGLEAGQVAASFALASAATILFSHRSPAGDVFVHELLRGEILTVGMHEFETLAVILGLVLAALFVWHRDILVVSYDREISLVLGKRVLAFDVLFTALTGLAVTVGTLTVGPVVLFGLLVIPPLGARRLAHSMISYYVFASALGLLAVLAGLWLSFTFDLPLGSSVVLAAALTSAPSVLVRRGRLGDAA